ncbi:hypothetical protein WJX74_009348 [Apatococcus lobatus]|uniref:Uncharacterized protein n=1 Tax=Apatococcus lobatus TaxID=904363 RepID=A0AAW1RPW7_9CHLO
MPFLKLWSSAEREYEKPLLEKTPESPSGVSDCSCSSSCTFPTQQAGSDDSNSTSSTSAPSELADRQRRSVPAGLSLIDPVRFGAASQPSEALLQLAVTFAERQQIHALGKPAHDQLAKLLSRHDWKLLLWSERKLVKLAASENLGFASLDKAASNPELRSLLQQRQYAWTCAHRIVKQWQRFQMDSLRLRYSFSKLWPECEPRNHKELIGEPCPECLHLKEYVKAFAMVPNAPEFHALNDCLASLKLPSAERPICSSRARQMNRASICHTCLWQTLR